MIKSKNNDIFTQNYKNTGLLIMEFKKGILLFIFICTTIFSSFSQTLLVGKDKVVKVGNKIITYSELKRAQNELNKLSPVLGKTHTEKEILQIMIDEEIIKVAIDNDPSLILNENAYNQEMESLKYQYTAMMTEKNPEFKFTETGFKNYIETEAKITFADFEKKIRQKVLANQLIMKKAQTRLQALSAKKYPEQQLIDYRSNNLHRFVSPRSVELKHIFFKTVGGGGKLPDSEKAIIKKKAQDVLKRLQKGENFDELCLIHTDDIQSRDVKNPKTGQVDRGYIGNIPISGEYAELAKQQFGSTIFSAIFTYKKGTYSPIMESPFGFHIFYIVNNQPERIIPYEEARDQIIYVFKIQEQNEIVQSEYKKLVDELRKSTTVIYYRDDLKP